MLPVLLACLWIFSLLSAGHALLTKRDPRASLGWIITILALPGIGALLYWLLGVNRIRTRARELQKQGQGMHWLHVNQPPRPVDLDNFPTSSTARALINLSDSVTRRPLQFGNRVTVLHNGEQAFPAMLEAIARAEDSVFLSSYIFKPDKVGRQFAEALISAAKRGVDVRVLIDAYGELYSFRKIRSQFRGTPVQSAVFLPLTLLHSFYFNLRNHRKLLVVDSSCCFTGGMNIRKKHLAAGQEPNRVIDIHFKLEGPIIGQLRDAFMEDWHFATDEKRKPKDWPLAPVVGKACCRG